MQRDLRWLADERVFDVLVVGGGITGAMVAWDAALRGFDVALIERGDFASGASANLLKLLHGGLRYLMRGELRTAQTSMRERRAWLRMAPHLVEPVPVLVPTYRGSLQNAGFVRALLAVNDLSQWNRNRDVDEDRHIAAARHLNRREVLDRAPDLEGVARLSGGAVFHDALLYSPERLVIEVLGAATVSGAVIANYVELESALTSGGRVTGARVRDRMTDTEFDIGARTIVNAAGAGSIDVAQRLTGRAHEASGFSVAFNVMIPSSGLGSALSLNASSGARGSRSRQLLRVPWRDREMLGTAHIAADESDRLPSIDESVVAGFLADYERACPGAKARIEDVLLVHAGLLPLGEDARGRPERVRRRHRLVDHAAHGLSGAFSLDTVKYTTARLAAEQILNAVAAWLGVPATPCRTAVTRLPDAPERTVSMLADQAKARYADRVAPEVVEHLVRAYGRGFERVLGSIPADPRALGEGSPVTDAELVHAVRYEMALSADDVLRRRVELGARARITPDARAKTEAILDAELGAARPRPPADDLIPPYLWDAVSS
jgi:glycerol-3-phosphate dehydrogenase